MRKGTTSPWLVAIGASGGQGFHDIRNLLRELPSALDAVALVVLHRPWDEPSHLAQILARASRLPVRVAEDGERLVPGTVYIGEPASHLALASEGTSVLVCDPHRVFRNRTVDLLFRSVAAHGGERIIGVILSGALDDGSRGLAAINEAGGLAMVVMPDASARPGMPENAIDYDGPIDVIGSPGEIATAICNSVQRQPSQAVRDEERRP